jgi:hypothetical protein
MLAQSVGGTRGRVISLWVAMHVLSVTAWAGYGGGDGTPENPYLVFTAQQLSAIGTQPGDWDKHFKLMADIDLSGYRGTDFHRIGTPDDGAFSGTFDGNYKTIFNFQWSGYARYFGLFGLVDGTEARVMNLTLMDPNVATDGGQYVGALVGLLRAGTVMNCHVRRGAVTGDNCVGGLVGRKEWATIANCTVCAVVRGANRVGGLVGYSYWGLTSQSEAAGVVVGSSDSECWAAGGIIGESWIGVVEQCHSSCVVEGNRCAGGVVGLNTTTSVRQCWADGTVRGEQEIGGLVGRNGGGNISDCYALARLDGTAFVGGLVGYHGPSCECSAGTPGIITRCYAAGPVRGLSDVGGLLALNRNSLVGHSFWDMQATGCLNSAGGDPQTTTEMQDLSTFTRAGWDFVGEKENGTEDIWRLPTPNGYPRLTWRAATGDLDADGGVDLHDYSIFANRWRQTDNGFWSRGAWLAADGVVDFDDLAILAQTWLDGCR